MKRWRITIPETEIELEAESAQDAILLLCPADVFADVVAEGIIEPITESDDKEGVDGTRCV